MPGIADLIGKFRRMMNMDAAETFDPATDSLEAISNGLAGVFGASGAAIIGVCPAGMAASTTVVVCSNLAARYEDDTFNSRYVMLVLKNANSAAAAPEYEKRDITDFVGLTATFTTEAFSANVEANDVVLILPYDIAAKVGCLGILTTSSATVPADITRRAGDANNYWRGCTLVPLSGVCRFQARRIVLFTTATGVFTLDSNTPFTAAPGTVPYVVINDQDQVAPAADAVNVYTPADTIGNKADALQTTIGVTRSLMGYLKGVLYNSNYMLSLEVVAAGTFTTSSATVPADTGRTEANDYFKGCVLMPTAGVAAFQPRPIRQFTSVTDVFTLDEPFTVAPGLVTYVIMRSDYPIQRLFDIFGETNAILQLSETGGTITTDGAVQTVYINNAPAGVYKPEAIQLDLTAMAAGDDLQVRVYYRISAAGNLIMQDDITFSDLQAIPLKTITLLPNRFGIQVTLQELAGAHNDIPWEVLFSD